MGIPGLELMYEAARENGLLTVSEVMEISQIESMLPYVDCFQVGARNMQNFNLLRELGKVRKPVLLKRGIAATIEETAAFERVHSVGRQLRRDPVRARHSHLRDGDAQHHGYFGDSGGEEAFASAHRGRSIAWHGTARYGCSAWRGPRWPREPTPLLVEVHPNADKAASDAAQTLYLDQFEKLMGELRVIADGGGKNSVAELGAGAC